MWIYVYLIILLYFYASLGSLDIKSDTTSSANSTTTKCHCCHLGYHIDLDFVKYCEQLKQDIDSTLQGRRRKRRFQQRQSMEVMLGLEQWNQQVSWKNIFITQCNVSNVFPLVSESRCPCLTDRLICEWGPIRCLPWLWEHITTAQNIRRSNRCVAFAPCCG